MLSRSFKREIPHHVKLSSAMQHCDAGDLTAADRWRTERVKAILSRVDRLKSTGRAVASSIPSQLSRKKERPQEEASTVSETEKWSAETQWTMARFAGNPTTTKTSSSTKMEYSSLRGSRSLTFVRPQTSQLLRCTLPIGIDGRDLRVILRLDTRAHGDTSHHERVAIVVEAYDPAIDCLYQLHMMPPESERASALPPRDLLRTVADSLAVEGATGRSPGSLVSSMASTTTSLRPEPASEFASSSQSSLFVKFNNGSSSRTDVTNDKLRVVAPTFRDSDVSRHVANDEKEVEDSAHEEAKCVERTDDIEALTRDRTSVADEDDKKDPLANSAAISSSESVEEEYSEPDDMSSVGDTSSDEEEGVLPSDLKRDLLPMLSQTSSRPKRSNSSLLAGFSLIKGELQEKGVTLRGMKTVIENLEQKCSDNEENTDVGRFLEELPNDVTTFLVKEGVMNDF
eukprot:g1368.t1